MAIGINRRQKIYNRWSIDKSILGFDVAPNWNHMKEQCKDYRPSLVLSDGEPEVVNWVKGMYPQASYQRCLWHIPRTLGWYLWKEGLSVEDRKIWLDRINKILHHRQPTIERAKQGLKHLIWELYECGLKKAADFLCRALSDVYTYIKLLKEKLLPGQVDENHPFITISILERIFREINRRTDNGARWSVPGLKNLVKLLLVKKYHPEDWKKLWNENDTMANLGDNQLNVNICLC